MKKLRKIVLFVATFLCWSQISAAQNIDELADAFGHIPDFAGILISPDGDKIATLMNYDGQRILVTKSLTDPNVAPVGIPFDEGEFRWVRWVSNDRLIAGVRYSAKIRQDRAFKRGSRSEVVEFTTTRLVSMDWNGENFVLLSKRNRGRNFQPQFQDNVIDMLPEDPDHVLLSLDVSVQNQPAIYKLNVHTNDRTLVHDDLRHVTQWITDRNHEVRFARGVEDTPRINESRRFSYYRKTVDDEWIKLYDYDVREFEAPFEFLGFAENPDHIYVSQLSKSGFKGIYKLDVDAQEIVETISESDEYDLWGIQYNESRQLIGYTYKHDMFKRVNFDEQGKKINRIFEQNFPDSEFLISSQSKDGNRLIVRTESSVDPGSYYLVDLPENKVELIDYNYKLVMPEVLSKTKPVKYRASDGIEINALLTIPKNETADKKLPTVILPVWRQGQRFYHEFHYWTQFFAANGYAVLQINYRGAGGYGQYYQNLGKGEMGRKIIQDVIEGTQWMIDSGHANPERICIAGDTFGAYISLQVPTVAPTLYKCSIAHAPVTSLDAFLRHKRDFVGYNYTKALLSNDEWDLDQASPLFNIDNMNVPVLLFHGEKDMVIPVSESRVYAQRMERAKKDIQYFEFEDADAYLSRQEHRIKFLKEMGHFLEKNLK